MEVLSKWWPQVKFRLKTFFPPRTKWKEFTTKDNIWELNLTATKDILAKDWPNPNPLLTSPPSPNPNKPKPGIKTHIMATAPEWGESFNVRRLNLVRQGASPPRRQMPS